MTLRVRVKVRVRVRVRERTTLVRDVKRRLSLCGCVPTQRSLSVMLYLASTPA